MDQWPLPPKFVDLLDMVDHWPLRWCEEDDDTLFWLLLDAGLQKLRDEIIRNFHLQFFSDY